MNKDTLHLNSSPQRLFKCDYPGCVSEYRKAYVLHRHMEIIHGEKRSYDQSQIFCAEILNNLYRELFYVHDNFHKLNNASRNKDRMLFNIWGALVAIVMGHPNFRPMEVTDMEEEKISPIEFLYKKIVLDSNRVFHCLVPDLRNFSHFEFNIQSLLSLYEKIFELNSLHNSPKLPLREYKKIDAINMPQYGTFENTYHKIYYPSSHPNPYGPSKNLSSLEQIILFAENPDYKNSNTQEILKILNIPYLDSNLITSLFKAFKEVDILIPPLIRIIISYLSKEYFHVYKDQKGDKYLNSKEISCFSTAPDISRQYIDPPDKYLKNLLEYFLERKPGWQKVTPSLRVGIDDISGRPGFEEQLMILLPEKCNDPLMVLNKNRERIDPTVSQSYIQFFAKLIEDQKLEKTIESMSDYFEKDNSIFNFS